jgi:tRNA(fMet)-specific endonuclease VapC
LKYLLDTNILVYLDKRLGRCLEQLQQHAPQDIVLSSVSLMEIEYGLARSERPDHMRHFMGGMRARYAVLDFDAPSAERAGQLKALLAAKGLPIGPFDLQIAGIALAHQLTVVTHNTREFSRVPGLRIEDWYE